MITSRFLRLGSALALAFIIPVSALAQGEIGGSTLGTYLSSIIGFINAILVPFIFAIAFIVFIWGIFQYFILGGANEEAREKGKSLAIWGLIAFVVMVSIWGIVNLFVGTFKFGGQNSPQLPRFTPGSTSGGSTTGFPTSGGTTGGAASGGTTGGGAASGGTTGGGAASGGTTGSGTVPGTNIPANLEGLY